MSTATQEPISKKTYETEEFTLSHSTFPRCSHVFDILLKQSFVNAMYEKAVKSVNKEVSVPGFRRGKAPEQYIKANFGKAIESEWKSLAADFAFSKAIELTHARPRSQDAVSNTKIDSLSRDKDSAISVTFESFSTVPEFKISDFHIEKVTVPEVTEEEIEKATHNVLLSHATWEDLPEKTIEAGDWVILDIDGTAEEKTFEIARDAKAQATKEQMNNWIVDLILGKKAGDVVEGWNQKDEKDPEENFVPTFCKITIKNVQAPKLPELNQELAEKMRLSDINELSPRIKQALEQNKQEEQKEKYHDAIIGQIHDKYSFEIPNSFTESEIKHAVNQEIKKLKASKTPDDEITAKAEALEIKARKDIEDSYRVLILSQMLAQQYSLNVSEQEILTELLKQFQQSPEFGRYFDPKNEAELAKVKSQIHTEKLVTKVLDKILEQL